ncbi:4-phosphoerythronate dehydrogenase PdxB [Hahella aquimaris]|uniref:4-phosphoerythronate dehydrogenase PdxB n=1 Tax=Hahella sp. HNIBRBA332 TaxID=3015983 RepID=UPI00273B1C89|nr:4-phosphoerythronate dehydrogenase PdxB [Hahella sp. HNIBRBA332]WLQ15328.1 4-phosphoerythronate dehydrogenase PdxB [Hahella sp. HNIBRBA332]
MKIVADENIPLLQPFFGSMGEIHTLPGREISNEHLRDADVLLVRSVTRVDERLLENTGVKFVGSATIGCNHVDMDYLTSRGVGFSNAPGCNASAVVEYVVSCLSVLSEQLGFELEDKTVGIIGRGEIGGRLERALTLLGLEVKSNDPPREAAGEQNLFSLDEVLQCDIITLHTPLTDSGSYPTRELLNASMIENLRSDQILINTCRGEVVDESALKRRLQKGDGLTVALDVWNNEPAIDVELAMLCHFATPHIAGYTLDGRTAGTEIIYQHLSRYLGLPVRHKLGQFLPEPPLRRMAFSSGVDPDWALHTAIRASYDVRHDDSQLKRTLRLDAPVRAQEFDRLRREYRVRRGFDRIKIELKGGKADLLATLSAVGFNLSSK